MKPLVLITNRLILRHSMKGDHRALFHNYTSDNEGILRNWLILPSFGNIPRDCFAFGLYRDSNLNWQ